MQHLCMCLPVKIEEYPFGYLSHACQAWVRFFALRRIKPHAPPLVRTTVNSFEFQSCDRSPQAVYLMGYRRHRWNEPPTPSIHRLQLGLPGYLIQFAPLASLLSVSCRPETRLRHGCSLRYLRISPLHRKFQFPFLHSSRSVSNAIVLLSSTISHLT